jgi:spoIIIJ-associated protein
MAGSRGGRRRGAKDETDAFRDALAQSLAEALGADVADVSLSVELAGGPVSTDLLPLTLRLAAPVTDAPDPSDEGEDDRTASEVEESVAAPARVARGSAAAGSGTRAGGRDVVGGGGSAGGASEAAPVSAEELDEEAEAAADLLEGLLDAMDLPGDLRISVQDAHAEVEVVGLEEGVLIGRRGQTLEAIQELVRTAMQRRFERRSRVMVDVDGYRARRLEKLLERAEEAVQEALASGEPQRLEPMDSIERRLVHQRVATFDGVTSQSHGREPARRIVIEVLGDE